LTPQSCNAFSGCSYPCITIASSLMIMTCRRIFFYFQKVHILHNRRLYLGALCFISIYSGSKCCPSPLDITSNRVFPCNFRNSSLFTDTWRNSPSVRCVSAANHVCKDVDVFRKTMLVLKTISAIYCYIFIKNYLCFFLGGG
jgi:hypothetical protein